MLQRLFRSESTEPASQTGDMSKSGVGEMLIHPKMATVSSLVEQLELHSPSNGSRQKELLSCIKWHLFGLIVSPCFSHEDCHTIHKTGGGEATSHHIFNGGSCYIAPFYWLQDHMAIIGENHMVIGLGIQTAYSDEGDYTNNRILYMSRYTPSGLLPPEKYGMSDWCKRIKVEDGTDYSPQSTIPITNGHPHPKSLFPTFEFEKQYSSFQDNGANTGSIFSEHNSRYPHDLADANSGPHSFFQDTSLGNEDLSVFDAGSTVQALSGISDSGRALSLLSSQSQNSSSHSSGIPMIHPLIMPGCHAHYNIAQVSEKFLGVSPSEPVNFEVTDGIFQGSDFVNTKDCLPCETGPTIDLLQLSSQLHRVEHQRQSIHVKQENDTFCLRITLMMLHPIHHLHCSDTRLPNATIILCTTPGTISTIKRAAASLAISTTM
ncbi:hypothetical protein CK203_031677 [Vitis vinifera]|uniref:Uncharacterized protein n=1 Tax=Vitis vinifera TaxID=29760 RepID=A0A438I367_VITVI|nr:hypothetical protein CK203_031677 [Vitis vinifera]